MKYFSSEVDTNQTEHCLNNSNFTMDSFVPINNNIPLQVLIRQMLDKAFGKPNRTINITEDQCNVENTNCEIDSPLKSLQDESINSSNETNDYSSLHKSCSNSPKLKNSKLITIEEENTDSLHNVDSIEYTGKYISELLKSNDKHVDRIKHNNPLPLQNDTEIFASQIDTDISIKDSFCHTNSMNDEPSLCQQSNDDTNESVNIINTAYSFNDADDSSYNDNSAEFLNILQKRNSPKTNQGFCESLSSLKEDRTESSINASLVTIDHSLKSTPTFISTLILKRRTPTSSLSTNNKPFKTPCYNTALAKKPVQYRSSFYVKTIRNTFKKTKKMPKTTKISPNRAKPVKSREIPKQSQMLAPQIIFTPATPK